MVHILYLYNFPQGKPQLVPQLVRSQEVVDLIEFQTSECIWLVPTWQPPTPEPEA